MRIADTMEVVLPELPAQPAQPLPPGFRLRVLFHRREGGGEYSSMELGVPPGMLPALRFIAAERPAFGAHELPELDPCEQHALVARLLQVGVLEVINARGPDGFDRLNMGEERAQ